MFKSENHTIEKFENKVFRRLYNRYNQLNLSNIKCFAA